MFFIYLLKINNSVFCLQRIKQATEQRALELRDQAQPPLDRAVFWVEYALRHGSAARRLRTATRNLSWWQRHSLDVVGVLVATLLLLPLSVRAFAWPAVAAGGHEARVGF